MKIEDAISRCRKNKGIALTHENFMTYQMFMAWVIDGEDWFEILIDRDVNLIVNTMKRSRGPEGLCCPEFLRDGWKLLNLGAYDAKDVATKIAQYAFETGRMG